LWRTGVDEHSGCCAQEIPHRSELPIYRMRAYCRAMSQVTENSPEDHSFFGQPRSLANLFGVEMWERFSFYGMQGILLLYLYYSTTDGGLGIEQATAAGIVGAYGGGVYLSTILGDRKSVV